MPVLPLIHIGYHKTATTWLQEHLFRNAAAGFAVQNGSDRVLREFVLRGPFAFDALRTRETLNKHILPLPASAHVPVITQERLSGSPHTGGYDSQIIADRLKAVFPEARILIVIREQVDIILSGYKQYVRNGGRQSLGLYLAPPENGSNHIPAFRYEFFEYHTLMGYYQTLFGKDHVLALPYEQFVQQPGTFVKNILSFSGLNPGEDVVSMLPFNRRSHPSLSFVATNLKRHLSALADVPSRYQHRGMFVLSPEQRHTILNGLERLDARLPKNMRQRSDAGARAFIHQEIKGRYVESNTLTSQLSNISLARFGYGVSESCE
jgi:Sulfotransferase family